MRGKKKVKLSPIQRAILSFPDSSGLASIRSMLIHLWREFPGASREAFIDDVGKNLVAIRRLGGLYLERQYGAVRRTITVNEWVSFSLRNFVVWDSAKQQWAVSAQQPGVDDIMIQLSRRGVDDLRLYEIQNKNSEVDGG